MLPFIPSHWTCTTFLGKLSLNPSLVNSSLSRIFIALVIASSMALNIDEPGFHICGDLTMSWLPHQTDCTASMISAGPESLGFIYHCLHLLSSLVAQMVKNLPGIQETQVQSLGREDPLVEGKAAHSSILGTALLFMDCMKGSCLPTW